MLARRPMGLKRPRDSGRTRTPPFNAAAALVMPSPYSPAHFVHPDVVHVPDGWNGYEWWMGVTPYPEGNNDYENPCILASHDRVTWVVPPGLTNPVAPRTGGFNSDTDLVLDGDAMRLLYRFVGASQVAYVRSSTDGVTWSAPVEAFSDAGAGFLSPAVVWDGTQWVCWTVHQTSKDIERRTASAVTGPWSVPVVCTYPRPANGGGTWDPWHIDVILHDGVYRMIVNESASSNPGIKDLRLASSLDGITWTPAAAKLMTKGAGTGFDSGQLYRATGVFRESDDMLYLWYSSTVGTAWSVAYTEIPAGAAGWFPTPA